MKTIAFFLLFLFTGGTLFSQNAPVAVADTFSVMMYHYTDLDVLSNDYDPDGYSFELYRLDDLSYGVSIENNKIRYIAYPWPDETDIRTLRYQIRRSGDTTSVSDWATVTIHVTPNPDLPVLIDDTVSGSSLFPLTVYPLENDLPNGADTMYITMAFNREVHVMGKTEWSNNKVVYTPYFSIYGNKNSDSITYLVRINDDPALTIPGKIYVHLDVVHTYDSLDINNINAAVNANGMLFTDHTYDQTNTGNGINTYKLHYEVPKGSGKHTIFVNRLWFGGLDDEDSLHIAEGRYDMTGMDFRFGPVADSYDSLFTLKYARVWKLTKQQIAYHRNNWWKPDYEPVDAIATWPGNGDVNNGEPEHPAPFFDRNQNGIYEPDQGDYPLIRGDEAVFFIMNDDRPHSDSQGVPLKIDFYGMVYGYDAPSDNVLFNTVFVHYTIKNRSENDYHNCYAGIFTDADIGYAWDDYIGCFVDKSSFYGYNGDSVDGMGEPEAYGENPPAQSTTFFCGPLMDADGTDNPPGGCDYSINGRNFGDGIVDNERYGMTKFIARNTGSLPPHLILAEGYYNYLRGLWPRGEPLVYGGNGYPGDSTQNYIPCSFIFPGNSDPCNWGTGGEPLPDGYDNDSLLWTEYRGFDFEPDAPGDRRGIGSTGPFTFPSGAVQELEIAFVTSFGNDTISSVEKLKRDLDSLFAETIYYPDSVLGVQTQNPVPVRLKIYPNPATNRVNIAFRSPLSRHFRYKIFNTDGTAVKNGAGKCGSVVSVNTGDLKPGLYILKIFTGKSVLSGKFVKF